MVQQKLVSYEKTKIDDTSHQDKPELRFPEFNEKWNVKTIKNVAQVIGGGTPKTDNDIFWDGDINWFTPSEIGRKYVYESKRKITEEGLNQSSAKLLPKNTILLSTRATIGEVSISKNETTTNQGFQSLVVKNNFDTEFIYYLTQLLKRDMIKLSSGSTFLEISKKEVEKIKINVPSIEEQKKIARFLSAIDNKIELLEKKCHLINDHKKGFIQKLRKHEIKFQNNGEDYHKWEETTLKDILHEHKLKSTGKEEVYSVSVHKGVVNQIEHLGRSFATDDLSKYKLVKPGDIVYTKSPTAGFELGIIKQNKNDKNVLVSPLYGVFSPKNIYLGNYIDAYFESSINTRNYLHPIVQKGAKNTMNITNKVFLSKSLLLPTDYKEQKKISDCIDLFNKKYDENFNYCENMKKFKKGLLQRMFV